MVETARAAKAAPLRRDAVLEAVAFAAERLLLSSDWNEVAVEVLGRLGVAAAGGDDTHLASASEPATEGKRRRQGAARLTRPRADRRRLRSTEPARSPALR